MSILAERLTRKKCAGCRENLDVWNTQAEDDRLCETCISENPSRCANCILEDEPCWECRNDRHELNWEAC